MSTPDGSSQPAANAVDAANAIIDLLPDPEIMQRWVARAVGQRPPRLDAVAGTLANVQLSAKAPDPGKSGMSSGPVLHAGQLGPLLQALGLDTKQPCPPGTDRATQDEMSTWAGSLGQAEVSKLIDVLRERVSQVEGAKPDASADGLHLSRLIGVLQAGLGLVDAAQWAQSGVDAAVFRSSVAAMVQTIVDGVNAAGGTGG